MKKLITLASFLVLLGFWTKTYAAISFVQSHKAYSSATGTTQNVAITTTAGNLLVAYVGSQGVSTSTFSIADSAGNTWLQAGTNATGSGNTMVVGVFYVPNALAITSATTTYSQVVSRRTMTIYEISGADASAPFDASVKSFSTGNPTTTVSGQLTTTNANDLLLFGGQESVNETTWTAGTNYILPANSTSTASWVEYTVTSTIQTNATTSITYNSGGNAVNIFSSFKAGVTGPDATSASTTVNGDGARSGDTITITGTNFGTVSAGNRATCNGGVGTGCVQFIAGGTDTVADPSISSWTSTAITLTVSSTLASNGGVSALEVWAANASDTTPLTYYIYPNITSVASIGTNAARTYSASDTDGLTMLAGNHFGTSGTSSILGVAATQHNSTGGSCTVAGYTTTTACFEVPSGIASGTYSGTVILTRGSDGKQATTSLSILPRITGTSPTGTYEGNLVQISGNHFCGPSGTCPVSPNRSSTTNNVLFGVTTSSDSSFVNQSGGAGACNGSGAAWTNGEICVDVPMGLASSSASSTVTSNGNTSNIFPFNITTPPAPGTPGTPTYASINSSTLTVSWASSTITDSYKIERATSSQSYAQIATTTVLSYADSGLTANTTFYYRVRGTNTGGDGPYSASSSVLTLPDIPGTPTFTNVSTSTLTVSWTPPATGAASYVVQRATSSLIYAQVTTTTATSTNDSGLAINTTYYYRIQASNATGNGQAGSSASVTTLSNAPPNAPSEDSPASSMQDLSTTPAFKMTATEPEGENLQYKVTIYSNSGCTTVIQTDDQSSSQTGWSGQNATSTSPGDSYTSGTQGNYTVQSALSQNATYYWKASAKDPTGANSWTDSATCNSFTTTYGNWTTDSGSWSISGNQLVITPASGASVQIHATGQSQTNGVIEFKVKSSAVGANTGNVAGIVRADSGANRYHLAIADFLNQQEAVGKTISSAYSSLATTAFTFSGAAFYELRGYISGTALKSWLNGGNALSTTDSALSVAGNIGLAASSTNGSATFTIDNFAFYASPTITMSGLPSGGSWSVRDHTSTNISCQTGGAWDLSTYSGQVPIDYDNGGGSVVVWASNAICSGSPDQTYPASGLATNIFGGDAYAYSAGTTSTPASSGGTVVTTTIITVSPAGAVTY